MVTVSDLNVNDVFCVLPGSLSFVKTDRVTRKGLIVCRIKDTNRFISFYPGSHVLSLGNIDDYGF